MSRSCRCRRCRCPARRPSRRWPRAARRGCSCSRRAWSRPGFALTAANAADIAAICGRLDGLPLAIELAAARIRLLAPRALLARLGHSLDLAAADVGQPSRQQTLRNAIAWSYDLLAPDLAEAFRRAGVFAGGCDLDALAAVAAADGQGAQEPGPIPWIWPPGCWTSAWSR